MGGPYGCREVGRLRRERAERLGPLQPDEGGYVDPGVRGNQGRAELQAGRVVRGPEHHGGDDETGVQVDVEWSWAPLHLGGALRRLRAATGGNPAIPGTA